MLHHPAGNAEVLLGTETCQPKHWEVRRKHIADGASKSKDGPPVKLETGYWTEFTEFQKLR
jgi:hypothetical protein